jgi:hypothetical protein
MAITLTEAQVLALAPDAASGSAAKGLAGDNHWVTLGADDEAAWGECKGSGAKPYQTQVELASLAARCSCPSRKFPCKHGLALMLLYARRNPRFATSTRPAWLDEWLNARKQKAEKKEKAVAAKATVDPAVAAAAAGKREAARWKRIEAGALDLQRWIADQFRRGLAKIGTEQRKEWSAMAARLVDAQAPGMASQLEAALAAVGAASTDRDEVVERLGLLQLLNEGIQRRDRLPPARLADVRAALGWPLEKEDVLAEGERITDRWCVLGQVASGLDERIGERRTWLLGRRSGRHALLLDYALQGKAFEGQWDNDASYDATLAFYPGSTPLRALVAEGPTPVTATEAEGAVAPAVDRASQWFADNPWLAQVPVRLVDATPGRAGEDWFVQTPSGRWPVRLPSPAAWMLLAHGGGAPLEVMGEWDGRVLRPLSARRRGETRACWRWNGVAA